MNTSIASHGRFEKNGDFIVTDRATPRPWYNYLFNDHYVACVSQIGTGEGFVQDSLGRRAPLVASRRIYLVDADVAPGRPGFWWMAGGPQPQGIRVAGFACRHRPGSTEVRQRVRGIESAWCVVVPSTYDGEIWELRLRNTGTKTRHIRALAFCGTDIDGPYRIHTYNTSSARYDSAAGGTVLHGATAFENNNQRDSYAAFLAFPAPDSFDTRVNVFRGVYESEQVPAAVLSNGGRCLGTDCIGEKCCLALEHDVELAPGKTVSLRYAVSFSMIPSARRFRAEARSLIGTEAAWRRSRETAERRIALSSDGIEFRTPNEAFNRLATTWLPAETALGSRWARVRHNGYRDLLNDEDCLASVDVHRAWKDLLRTLSYQYSSGYAPRTFVDGKIQDRNYADCASGIAPTILGMVEEMGDPALLDTEVPFNDGSVGSVWEHARRSADWLWNFRGTNGLVKIWGGDWNDCMVNVGTQGRGTSVWLSLATVNAFQAVEALAALRGDKTAAAQAARRTKILSDTINRIGWDGDRYVYAFHDDGRVLGARSNREGGFHLICQAWAIITGVASPERTEILLRGIAEKLDSPWGALIMDKGYSSVDPTLGYIGTKAPGIHENGGIYLHALCWLAMAIAKLGRAEDLWDVLQHILPVADGGQKRVCEPYVLSNSIFGPQTGYRAGTPGQSWRTASGACLLKLVVRNVFGFRPSLDGLRLRPCLPRPWWGSRVRKTFRGATYEVLFRSSNATRLTVDGKPFDANRPLPCVSGKIYRIVVG